MAKSTRSTLTLETRDAVGTTSAKALRKTGKVPGVVYGHGQATPVVVDAKELQLLLVSGNRSHIVDATIGGAKDSVLLRRVETDPLSRKPLSVDFQRVSRDEAVTAQVTVTAQGTPRGVRDQGGVLDIVTRTLEIKGPASGIPDHLEIDVTALGVHEHVNASQVPLPKGFTLLTAPETVVIAVEVHRAPAAGAAETPAAPAEAPQPQPPEAAAG